MAKKKKDPNYRRRLALVKVNEVSLVDQPAVPLATYTIVKRDPDAGDIDIDLAKACNDEAAKAGMKTLDKESEKVDDSGDENKSADNPDAKGDAAKSDNASAIDLDHPHVKHVIAAAGNQIARDLIDDGVHSEHDTKREFRAGPASDAAANAVNFEKEKFHGVGGIDMDNKDHANAVKDKLAGYVANRVARKTGEWNNGKVVEKSAAFDDYRDDDHPVAKVETKDNPDQNGGRESAAPVVLAKYDNPSVRQALANAIQSLRGVADQLDPEGLGMLSSLLYWGRRCCYDANNGCGPSVSCYPSSSCDANYNGIDDDLYAEVSKGLIGDMDVESQLAIIRHQLDGIVPAAKVAKNAAANAEPPAKPKPADVNEFPIDVAKGSDGGTLEEQIEREFQRRNAERAAAAEKASEVKLVKSLETLNQQLADTMQRAEEIERKIALARGRVLDA